jgi:hypothetical protein
VIDGISWTSTGTITDAERIDKESKVETGICISQWLEHENLAGTKLGRLCAFLGTLSFRRHVILSESQSWITDKLCEEIRLLDFETPPEAIWMEKYVPFDSILCDYSVAFWDTVHLFEPSRARLRPSAVDTFSYIPEGRSIFDFCSSVLSNNCISSLTSCESAYSFWILASSHSPPQKVRHFELFRSKYQQVLH